MSASVSASVSDGFVGFKAEIVSATETSLVIKVTGKAGAKKCSVTLSITIPADKTASGQPVVKENIKTVGIGIEPEILQTEHVKVERLKGGLKFTIKRPSESCYNPKAILGEVKDEDGNPVYVYNYVGEGNGDFVAENGEYKQVADGEGSYIRETRKIYGGFSSIQITGSAGMPVAKVIHSNDKDLFECVYPLCDSGKRYDFGVNIEPLDRNLRQFYKLEKLSVVADDGIGEIDFSKNGPSVDLSYDGEKPIVKFSNLNLPSSLKNARTGIEYWATNQSELKNGDVDWGTPYALVWIAPYYSEVVVTECSDDPCSNGGGFNAVFNYTEKDTLYAHCFVEFEIPESSGFSWRTQPFTALLKIR